MKIATIYFKEKIPNNRISHDVNEDLLRCWLNYYQKSGTSFPVFLITDQKTKIPDFWTGEVVRIRDSEPPQKRDVLHKVGWLRSQAYEQLGKCLVLDVDALILSNLDELKDWNNELAMAPDPVDVIWSKRWPEVGIKHNAGVILMNSPKIIRRFREIWNEKFQQFSNITYFEECIFSALFYELESKELYGEYNHHYDGSEVKNVKILHFSGSSRKENLKKYVSNFK